MARSNKMYLRTIANELRALLSDRFMLMLIFIIPAVSFLIFAGIYTHAVVRDLPITVVDHDNSSLSRMLQRSFDSTPSMKVVERTNDYRDIQEYFTQENSFAVLVIPEKFERDIKAGMHPTVLFYKNSNNIIISNQLFSDAQTVTKTINAGIGIQKLSSKGLTAPAALNVVSPITIQSSPLFNPFYSYEKFLPIGLYLALMQMVFMVAVIMHAYKMKQTTTGLTISSAGLVFVTQALLHGFMFIAMLFGVYRLFGVDLSAGFFHLCSITVIFFVILFLLSMMISLIKEGLEKGLVVAIFFATPGFILSGYTFPLRALPGIFAAPGKFFPFTVYLNAFIKCAYMEAPSQALSFEASYTFTTLCILLAMLSIMVLFYMHTKGRQAK